MSLIEPLGVRFFGIEFKESHLNAISRAINDAGIQPELYLEKIGRGLIRFGDLFVENEQSGSLLLTTNLETIRELFKKSGLSEQGNFLRLFVESLSKNKSLVNFLSSFTAVSIEEGSLIAKYRNHKQIDELKLDLRKLWKLIKEQGNQIVNCFNQLAEYASLHVREVKENAILFAKHIGIYASALTLVFTSLWYSVAFQVTSGLSTIAQNLLNHLKASWPIINAILFIICAIYGVMGGEKVIGDAIDAAKKFYGA